jgi:hypothetical protein
MANKLPMLEDFEQTKKDPCQCGGNCGCGGNKSVNEDARIVLVDPNTNKFKKTVFYSGPNRDADAEVEKLNKKLSNSQKQKGFYWKIAAYESLEEAKKYKFKDLAKAWEFVYGEDMEDEYEGFYQEVTGKYKNKVTKKDIAEIWQKVYGEDIEAEYDGFYNELKENLNEASALEEFNGLNEAKSDGTISDDEDERMDIAEQEFYDKALALAQELKEEAYEIGGDFRGPGYEHKLMLQVKDAFKKAKLKLR